jgi:hypothetical protein
MLAGCWRQPASTDTPQPPTPTATVALQSLDMPADEGGTSDEPTIAPPAQLRRRLDSPPFAHVDPTDLDAD